MREDTHLLTRNIKKLVSHLCDASSWFMTFLHLIRVAQLRKWAGFHSRLRVSYQLQLRDSAQNLL